MQEGGARKGFVLRTDGSCPMSKLCRDELRVVALKIARKVTGTLRSRSGTTPMM